MTDKEFMVKLRLHGRQPACAFVLDYPARPSIASWSVEQQMRGGALPAFHVEHLNPAREDFRFLVGVPVHLHSDNFHRAVAWVDRLLQDGAGPVYQTTLEELTIWPASSALQT